MSKFFEFKIDKKQDNKRTPIKFELIRLSYIVNDIEISREIKHYKSHSGYCLDPVIKNDSSVSFDDIGKVFKWVGLSNGIITFEIYSYLHNELKSKEKLLTEILIYKNDLIKKANSIPTN